ncbi:MAG: 3,4-dihydroxy-2-butanone-4-phosphate synthase [Betaproteobacteria bacterium]|nr:3,4-dihydroxy-2-butanone-4-phosphate synthase [Betaproteobacteria bacterium]
MAGLAPAAVICEILKDDGTMARLPDLIGFAATHGLKIGAIADLIPPRADRGPGRAHRPAVPSRPRAAASR